MEIDDPMFTSFKREFESHWLMEHNLFVCLDSTLQNQIATQAITSNKVLLLIMKSKLNVGKGEATKTTKKNQSSFFSLFLN